MSWTQHSLPIMLWLLLLLQVDVQAQWAQIVTNIGGELTDVSFGSKDKIWAVGYSGSYTVLIRTTDAGLTWQGERSAVPVGRLNGVQMLDTLTGYAAGSKGVVMKRGWVPGTVGIQWHQLPKLTDNDLGALFFLDALTGWIPLQSDKIAKTTDGGETWTQYDVDAEPWAPALDIQFVDAEHGWTAGYRPCRTTDGGLTWTRMTVPALEEWRSVHFVNRDLGFLAGRVGKIARTTDGGVTWSSVWSTTGVMLMDVDFANASEGWIVGGGIMDQQWIDSSRVLHTTDGGVTWVQETHPTDRWLTSIDVVDSDNIIAVGGGGTVITRTRPVSVVDVQHDAVIDQCVHDRIRYFDLMGRELLSASGGLVISTCNTCARSVMRIIPER